MKTCSIQTLAGSWRLALDPKNEGREHGWFRRIRGEALAAPVPGIIQQVFSDRYGVAWYWLAFRSVLSPGPGRRLLRFGAVDYLAEVWLNGVAVGSHEGGETPFALDVTATLKSGEDNLLAVRVLNPTLDRIDGMVLAETPHTFKGMTCKSGALFNFGGLIQPVELAVVPDTRLVDVFVRGDPKTGRVRAVLTVRNDSAAAVNGRLNLAVASAATGELFVETDRSSDFPPGTSEREMNLTVAQPRLWDLDDPFLYRAEACLEVAGGAHTASVRFGFRDFRVENGYFRLNGRRIFLRSTHTVNHYPIGQVVPPTPDFLRRDLLYAKTSGFNAVRFIGCVPYPEQLDCCDEIGLMVYEETHASWLLCDSPKMTERYDRGFREAIVRDRNHPSVTIWGLLNEMPDNSVFRHAVAFLPELRKLDDTRLVLLNSGRWDMDTSVGSLSNPGSDRWEYEWGLDAAGVKAAPNASDCNNCRYVDHTGEVHLYPPAPHVPQIVNFIRTLARDTKPIFFSEFGMGSLFNAVEEWRGYEQAQADRALTDAVYVRVLSDRLLADWKRFGMADAYPFPEDMFRASYAQCVRQRRLGFDLVRSNPKLCGFNVTGMLDHVFTGEGLWTFWREWKPGMLDALRDGWAPLRWCLFVDPMHVYAGRPFIVEAVLASEDVLPSGDYPATFRIFGPQGMAWEKRKTVKLRKSAQGETPLAVPVLKTKVQLNLPEGKYTLAASLDRGGRAFGDRKDFQVTDPAQFPALKGVAAVWGMDGHVRQWLERRGLRCRPFDGKQISLPKVILVGDPACEDGKALLDQWKRLMACVEKGAVAVFLSRFTPQKAELLGFFPEKIGHLAQIRDWLYHKECVARPHPIFEGLQAPGVLDWEYYDQIVSHQYFEAGEAPDETALAAFAVGHSEPKGGYASGIMIGVYGLGRGRFVLNTLNVLEWVDRHPAADRLLANFVRYAQAKAGEALASGKRRFAGGLWSSRYKPDPYSGFKRKWAVSGSCPLPANIAEASLPPAGLDWTQVAFSSDFADLNQLAPGQGGLVYARGRLTASPACRANILLGTDGPCKLWVDGKQVGLIEKAGNPARKDLHAFPVRLQAGDHEVVIAFDRRGGNAEGFFLRLFRVDKGVTREERMTMLAALPQVDA